MLTGWTFCHRLQNSCWGRHFFASTANSLKVRSVKKTCLPLKFIAVALLLIACSGVALADRHVVEKITITKSADGEAGKQGRIDTWLGDQKFCRVDSLNNVTTIGRIDLGKLFIIYHDTKITHEIELPFTLPKHLQDVFSHISMNWKLDKTDESMRIGDWDCQKVIITGNGSMSITVEAWMAEETRIDTRAYHTMMLDTLKTTPIYQGLVDLLINIFPSYAIKTTTTIQKLGMTTQTVAEVQSIRETTPPMNTYYPPEDYTVKPFDFSAFLSLTRDRQPRLGGN
jgi:hypothetical protein